MAAVDEVLPAELSDYPQYKEYQAKWKDFFENFTELRLNSQGEEMPGLRKYADAVLKVTRGQLKHIDVDLDDVQAYKYGAALVVAVEGNAKRHVDLACKAIDEMIKEGGEGEEPFSAVTPSSSRHDLYMAHRVRQLKKALDDQEEQGRPRVFEGLLDGFPSLLKRAYELRFTPRSDVAKEPLALRAVRGEHLGKYVTVKAIVLRVSDVKSILRVASYTCDVCGYELFQPVAGKSFMPASVCISPSCLRNNNVGRLTMQTRASKFVKYQELRVQELPEQVPVGHIPRSMSVIAMGETTRTASAGDVIIIGGIFLPTPYTGYQAIKAGLTADTYLEAHHILKTKKVDTESLPEETMSKMTELLDGGRPYEELAASIAPEIYGHEDVKKALLLQLVGGATNIQKDGMKTRGDINICLMGDPGVAKSQLLKHIARSAPRAVYTTGKGSSGVGLTAAVVRDPMTQELALEGGALVLADKGICCIDEFDKMEESDRTAIHEVMEQQTVSIAKAGITTTLNARTAILAAANPRYGRYNALADRDPHVAMVKNINLPAALLSRFDLMFVLLDKVDSESDKALAEHITHVHMFEATPERGGGEGAHQTPHFIRQYVNVARNIAVTVPKQLTEYIVAEYVQMRADDLSRAEAQHNKSTTTPRQLLSILRLAEAKARLSFREKVSKDDVEEAIRLIRASKASISLDKDTNFRQDTATQLCDILKDMSKNANLGYVLLDQFKASANASGFTEQQLSAMLIDYEVLGIIQYNTTRDMVYFVEAE